MPGDVFSSPADLVEHVQHLGLDRGALAQQSLDVCDLGLDAGQTFVKRVLLGGHPLTFATK